MEQAGWKKGRDGIRVKDGKRCEVSFYFNSKNTQEKTIAEVVQADLRRIGIDMKIIGEEKQAYLDRQRTGKFDMQYSLSWGAPYDPQSYFSSWRIPAHGDYQAQIGLADKPIIDKEITALMTEPDEARRQELTTDILKRIHASAVYVPVSFSRTKAVHSSGLHGVTFAVSQYEIPFETMTFDANKAKKK
jgi:nickel transport system substrate-binding protein